MVYPKSLYRNERIKSPVDSIHKTWPTNDKLSKYISYIYLPIGILALIGLAAFRDSLILLIMTVLWAAGYILLIRMDEVSHVKR